MPALGAADLVGAALEAFATDADLLAAERARVRVLLVDDVVHLDPQAALLVRVLAAGADTAMLAGDPNQAVFGFRGADAGLLLASDPDETLQHSYRCAPAIARAISGVGRFALRGSGDDAGSVTVTVAASAHAESALIADTLRRAHLVDGVPWSQVAVIVRSVAAAAALPRALAAAGVPVDLSPLAGPVADQPAARALLTVLSAVVDGVDDEQAEALLTGPIGRLDPVSMRQLRRSLRRNDIALRDALTGRVPQLPAALAAPVNRVRRVLAAAGRAHRENRDPRYTLWQAWERSGLQRRWLTAADRAGVEGQWNQREWAQRSLAAVTALFDIADDYVSRTTGASVHGLLDHVGALQLAPVTDKTAARETVAVLSPHAALGRDWHTVIIAGVQEGLWPNTAPRGGVLGTQRLLDALDGLGDDVSAYAPVVAEERRLLIAAMGRARSRLIVTAVDREDGDDAALPSSFVTELFQWANQGAEPVLPVQAPPVLSPASVVGRLRALVCATGVDDDERAHAAAQLARLAAAGVPGADPSQWHGLEDVSTYEPLWSGDHTVTLSPSTLQTLTDCPLRWMAERHGGSNARELSSTLGSVVHALVAEPGRSEAAMAADLERIWAELPFDSPWFAANELERHRAMLSAFVAWRSATRDELTEVGTEIELTGAVAEGVAVRGRIDRLERDAQGRLVVVDLKTGKTPVSKDDAQNHAQLGLYQLAVSAGLFQGDVEPGGGRLVYLGKPTANGNATEREQTALGPEGAEQWRDTVRDAAAVTAGPTFVARVNDGCAHCPIKPICPAHVDGDHV